MIFLPSDEQHEGLKIVTNLITIYGIDQLKITNIITISLRLASWTLYLITLPSIDILNGIYNILLHGPEHV